MAEKKLFQYAKNYEFIKEAIIFWEFMSIIMNNPKEYRNKIKKYFQILIK